MMLAGLFAPQSLAIVGEIILIDLTLASDNAVVIGSIAANVREDRQRRVILVGTAVALVLRIALAAIATLLLKVTGLLLAGGLLLLWVAWRMWRELRRQAAAGATSKPRRPRSFWRAVAAVVLADLSMSLDNVLGVAGAARDHLGLLAFGLIFSVALMGLAANVVARIIERYRWIGYIGLAVIIWVAGRMIYDGLADPRTGLISALS